LFFPINIIIQRRIKNLLGSILLKIEEKLTAPLKRINFIFQNKKIVTECIQDHNEVQVLDMKIGPFKKGKRYNLKFFIAVKLINQNILKIPSEDKCDNVVMQRFAMRERDDHKLIELEDKLFLNKIKEFRNFIKKALKEGTIPKINFDKFNSYMGNFVDSRLLKLLRLGSINLSVEDEQRLTNSEKVFYKKISDLIKSWRSFFLTRV